MTDDDLSPAELAFRELLSKPAAFAQWAAGERARWERDRGVEWLHHEAGAPVWRPVRPEPHPERTPQFRMNPNSRETP